ncbi:hypothetical protein NI497_000761 [Salmonella enterica]|nr:hypothetical protein [Salmonella enterica subsp. enterica serovar Enteritidis]EJJ4404729.1 hypothetical protein [Salmonella enterica]EKC2506573.1 hypothetical protein [Salmonella enterica]EKC3254682.1 hypothetical protein [Salmonella enterica]ELG6860507.1 hypothetical protein [Salmonella enterica]
MPSKEDLINAFNKSASDKEISEQRTNNDIKEFQSRVSDLFNTMEGWLDGTPVKIEKNSFNLNDVTTAPKTYSIESITLSNDSKRLTFTPTALYLMGSRGEVEIKFTGINRTLKCNLYMRDSIGGASDPGIWSLVDGNDRRNNRRPFTQEVFYELVTRLA